VEDCYEREMEAIRKNKTWRLTDRPASRRVLKGNWVYKVKNEVDKNGNNTTRLKTRLCFMGNRQFKGLDFNETFAPVAKFTTIRCILAMTAANGWKLHQMDVKTAFLNGDLDEEVYMEQPDGYVNPTYPDKVCRLLQALYRLKQAPKMWYGWERRANLRTTNKARSHTHTHKLKPLNHFTVVPQPVSPLRFNMVCLRLY